LKPQLREIRVGEAFVAGNAVFDQKMLISDIFFLRFWIPFQLGHAQATTPVSKARRLIPFRTIQVANLLEDHQYSPRQEYDFDGTHAE
jgi:hypothetical protein